MTTPTNVPVVFGVSVAGADAAVAQFSAIEQAEKEAASAAVAHGTASSGASQRIVAGMDNVAGTLQGLSRDVDTVGGQFASTFAKAANDVLGVAAAFGTGGLTAALGAVTLAAGFLKTEWDAESKAAEDAAKTVKDNIESQKKSLDALTEAFSKARQKMGMDTVLAQEDALNARRVMLAQRASELVLQNLREEEAAKKRTTIDGIVEDTRIRREGLALRKSLADEQAKIEADAAEVSARKNKLLQREANESLAESGKEAADIVTKTNKDRADAEESLAMELERIRKEDAAAENALRIRVATERKALVDQAAKDAEAGEKVIQAAVAQSDAAILKNAEAVQKKADADEKAAKALRDKAAAEVLATQKTALNTTATVAYNVAATAVTPVVGALTGSLTMLGDVNRENYEIMLKDAQDLPAIVAKKAQAILAGIAAEAAAKTFMETAEAGKETALAFGSLAIYDSAGAGLHFASAATHGSAAAAYSVLGGVSAGGALGIGMSRGRGGLVGLTKEEAGKRNDKERGSGGGGSAGTAGGSLGSGMGSGDGSWTVNIKTGVWIGPADEQRAERSVASAVRGARRGAFLERQMRDSG